MEVKRFKHSDTDAWNGWIVRHHGSFFFHRDYLNYHGDRLEDHSLMFYNDGQLAGVIPAMQYHDVFHSHRGLSYGGWIGERVDSKNVIGALSTYLISKGFNKIIYRPQPEFYAQETVSIQDSMELESEKLTFLIPLDQPLRLNSNRKRNLKKVEQLEVSQVSDFEGFYDMLSREMEERHGSAPIHNYVDLNYLYKTFPENIKIFAGRHKQAVGYIMAFQFRKVVKCQYIVSDSQGYNYEAITQIVLHLAEHYKNSHSYLDLGAATDQHGALKESLVRFKKSLGAMSYAVPTYTLDI